MNGHIKRISLDQIHEGKKRRGCSLLKLVTN